MLQNNDHLLGPAFQRFVGVVGEAIAPPGDDGFPVPLDNVRVDYVTWNGAAYGRQESFHAMIVVGERGQRCVDVYPSGFSVNGGSVPVLVIAFHELNDCGKDGPGRGEMVRRIREHVVGVS